MSGIRRKVGLAIGRDQHDHGVGAGRGDPPGGLDPADAGHLYVHQDQVRAERPGESNRLLPSSRLADQLEAGRRCDHRPGGPSERGLVVDHDDAHHVQRPSGIAPATRAPRPGEDSIRRRPPIAPSLSVMFVNPAPRASAAGSKPAPVVGHLEEETSLPLAHVDRCRGGVAGVLAGVLQCLETAEVHGRLDLGRVTSDTCDVEARRQRGPRSDDGESLRESALRQEGRIDAVRELPQPLERRLGVLPRAAPEWPSPLPGRSRSAPAPGAGSR